MTPLIETILLHADGRPRRLFRSLLLHGNGRPRGFARRWLPRLAARARGGYAAHATPPDWLAVATERDTTELTEAELDLLVARIRAELTSPTPRTSGRP